MYHCFFIFVVFWYSLIKHSGYDAILPCFFLLTLFAPPPLGYIGLKNAKLKQIISYLTSSWLHLLYGTFITQFDRKGLQEKMPPFLRHLSFFLSSSSSPVCESIDFSGGGPKQGQVLVMRRLLSMILDYLWVLLRSTKFSYSVGGIRMDGMVMNVQSNWRAIKGYIISKKLDRLNHSACHLGPRVSSSPFWSWGQDQPSCESMWEILKRASGLLCAIDRLWKDTEG